MPLRRYCFLLLLVIGISSYGQWSSSTELKRSVRTLTKENSGLFNGVEYEPHPVIFTDGHPFYQLPSLQKGSVTYNGDTYEDVDIMYDLVRDELIIGHYNGFSRIQLIKEKVDSFRMGELRFVHVRQSSGLSGLSPGFYQLLHNGKVKLLQRNRKTLQVYYRGSQSGVDVFEKIDRYLLKDQHASLVNRKKSFLDLLPAKEKVVQQLRTRNILYKDSPTLYMQQALIMYDQSN